MTTPMTLHRDPHGPKLSVAGEVDMGNADQLADAIDDALAESSRLQVDLRGLAYIDSAGLRVLLTRAANVELVANQTILPVLEICGLTKLTAVEVIPD